MIWVLLAFSMCKTIKSLNSDSLIVFHPNNLYLIKGSKVDLHLYYGFLDKDNIIKPVECIDLKNNNNRFFELKSDNPSLVKVSQNGSIEALQNGKASIRALDLNNLSNVAQVVIHVVYPDHVEWDNEQWIKPSYLKKYDKSNGPFNPNVSNISLFYKENKITLPNNYTVTMKNNLDVGTNNVEFTFTHINYSFNGIVHVCPPPRAEHEKHYIYIGFKDYQFKIFGGSGHFNFNYNHSILSVDENDSKIKIEDNENVLTCTIHPIQEGKCVIQLTDKKFNDYNVNVTIIYYSDQITPLPPTTPLPTPYIPPYWCKYVHGTPTPLPSYTHDRYL